MLNDLIALSRIAGDAVREVYELGSDSWETTLKADQSPLTRADRASHKILCEGLSRIAPGIPILSEESEDVPYEVRTNWETYFLIDPLDGTREFVARIPEFAINIALIEKGAPVLGLIHSPLNHSTFFAEKGKGAFKINGTTDALPVSKFPALSSVHVLLSRGDKSSGLERLLDELPDPTIGRMGSSLKFCEVAEGKADFYPRLKPSMEWDTASGTIIVQESGGIVCGLSGERIEYNRQDMLNPPFFVIGKSLFEKMQDWKERLFK